MVSQTPDDRWESCSPSKDGSTLSLDCRQQQLLPNGRIPPSYFDAVRSRHSFSQTDTVQPEKPVPNPQQIKYNSLPRPLPQRFQAYPVNGVNGQVDQRTPWVEKKKEEPFSHYKGANDIVADKNGGFKIYARPPGPANHVPVIALRQQQSSRSSNSNSLPRRVPPNNYRMDAPNGTMKREKYNLPPAIPKQANIFKQNGNSASIPSPMQHFRNSQQQLHRPMYSPQPLIQQTPPHDLEKSRIANRYKTATDLRSHMPSQSYTQGPLVPNSPYHVPYNYQNCDQYVSSNKRWTKSGTLPPRYPPKQQAFEERVPEVSIRTGPLGSYPDKWPPHPDKMPPKSTYASKSEYSDQNQHLYSNGYSTPSKNSYERERKPVSSPQAKDSGSPALLSMTKAQRYDHYLYPNGDSLGTRTEHCNGFQLPSHNGPENAFSSPESSLRIDAASIMPRRSQEQMKSKQSKPLHTSSISSSCQYLYKPSDDDSASSTPSKNFSRETPEEAGLVMIVESRDLSNQVNSVPKDVVKPTPRIPVSPTQALSVNCGLLSCAPISQCYPNSADRLMIDTKPYSPSSSSFQPVGRHKYDVRGHSNSLPSQDVPNGTDSYTAYSDNGDLYRAVPSTSSNSFQHLKPFNGSLARRPLSSSTASLSSEMSSVSSKNRNSHSDGLYKRASSSHSQLNEMQKKNEVSPSPWVREEKEEMQKQQIIGVRRVRDAKIEYLECKQDKTEKEKETLRILRLEQEFQRRAEELNEDEDEEDEALLERAEYRERMLMLMKERDDNGLSEKQNGHSSSDLWLASSQSKHPSHGRLQHLALNESFEVEQFNDLLETMNMSPVPKGSRVRSADNQDEALVKTVECLDDQGPSFQKSSSCTQLSCKAPTSHSHDVVHCKPVPAPRISKTSPVPVTSSITSSVSIELCIPAENKMDNYLMNRKSSKSDLREESLYPVQNIETEMKQTFREDIRMKPAAYSLVKATPLITNITRRYDDILVPNTAPFYDIEEKNHSKLPIEMPLIISTNEAELNSLYKNPLPLQDNISFTRRSIESSVPQGSKKKTLDSEQNKVDEASGLLNPKSNNLKTNNSFSSVLDMKYRKANNRPISDGNLGLVYASAKSSSNSVYKDPCADFNISPEYKKIWINKPEKLSFLEKIRKFSLQAGDDDVPRDKVKNSRAQRELEMKFSSSNSKSSTLPSST